MYLAWHGLISVYNIIFILSRAIQVNYKTLLGMRVMLITLLQLYAIVK